MTHAVGQRPALLAALLAAGIAFGCESRRPEGNAIVVAITNSPLNLDPRVGSGEASQKAHQLLHNTLLRIDDDLQTVPDLAQLEQSDPLTYVAHLRRGVLCHNGRGEFQTGVARP